MSSRVRFFSIIILVFSLLLSVGCVYQSSLDNQTVENSDVSRVDPNEIDPSSLGANSSLDEPENTARPNITNPDKKVVTQSVSKPSRAIQNLISESNQLLAKGEWEAAIAIAERGIRIDRTVPELYLAIARGYEGLADMPRARQFAHQGLRYVANPDDVEIAEDLRRLEGLSVR